jgi:type IV pilus assembly protein PilV
VTAIVTPYIACRGHAAAWFAAIQSKPAKSPAELFPQFSRHLQLPVRQAYLSALQCSRATSTRSQRGFSMVEVLISILVLTFGMLGMVGMQAAALHANREARLQSTAAVLARELADMIRGNKSVGVLATSNPYLGDFSTSLVYGTPSYCLAVAASTTCADTTAIANAEMTEWLARVDAELPGARVVTCLDTAPFDASSGLPQWGCTAGASAAIVIKIGWTQGSTNKSLTGTLALDRASDSGSVPLIVLPVTAGI